MRTRLAFFVALAAIVLAVAALSVVLFRPLPSFAATSTAPQRELTVVGKGTARGTPDTVVVQLGVQTQAESAQVALRENNAKMQALLARLKELEIPDAAIQTSNLSIWPMHEGPGPQPTGYQAANNVTVTLNKVDQTGALLEKVVDAGANNIAGISFSMAKPEALEHAAREQAIADARARAGAVAKASGATIGRLLRITESVGTSPAMPLADGAGAMPVMAAPPIQPGEQIVPLYVQATFELN